MTPSWLFDALVYTAGVVVIVAVLVLFALQVVRRVREGVPAKPTHTEAEVQDPCRLRDFYRGALACITRMPLEELRDLNRGLGLYGHGDWVPDEGTHLRFLARCALAGHLGALHDWRPWEMPEVVLFLRDVQPLGKSVPIAEWRNLWDSRDRIAPAGRDPERRLRPFQEPAAR